MNIGEAATGSGVTAKMIRYYESVGLIVPADRTAAGYRRYSPANLQTLRFVRRARGLGFSVGQMTELLALWRDQKRASADVKRLALAHAAALEQKAQEIAEMSRALRHLAAGAVAMTVPIARSWMAWPMVPIAVTTPQPRIDPRCCQVWCSCGQDRSGANHPGDECLEESGKTVPKTEC